MYWPFITGLLIRNAPDSAASAVRFDERPCQLLEDVVIGLRVKPGKAAKEDSEYIRQGTGVVLLAYDYDRGIRYTQTRKRRTKADYAEFMQQIVSTYYVNVEYIDLSAGHQRKLTVSGP